MSLDARIESIARQVLAEGGTTGTDSGLRAALSEYGFKLDAALTRVDDLHRELHAVATRLAALENTDQPDPEAAPRTRRTAARKQDA
jgi:hypothetical protein